MRNALVDQIIPIQSPCVSSMSMNFETAVRNSFTNLVHETRKSMEVESRITQPITKTRTFLHFELGRTNFGQIFFKIYRQEMKSFDYTCASKYIELIEVPQCLNSNVKVNIKVMEMNSDRPCFRFNASINLNIIPNHTPGEYEKMSSFPL